jgi:hypothetical protein
MHVDDLIIAALYHSDSDNQLLSISAQAAEAHVQLLGLPHRVFSNQYRNVK